MKEVLLNIYSLFYKANPASPYGTERDKEFNKEHDTYEEKVKYFTNKHAFPNSIRDNKENRIRILLLLIK